MKKYKLTDEHRAQLKGWAEKWIKNAMSTEPMSEEEKEICRAAVKGLYEAAGLNAPPSNRIVFVPSPFVAAFASGAAAWLLYCRANRKIPKSAATEDATRAATWDATEDATWAATWAATRAATEDATRAATEDATWAATWAATEAATEAAPNKLDMNWFMAGGCGEAVKRIVGDGGLQCAKISRRMQSGGNQSSGFISFLSFFRHVAKLNLDYSRFEHLEKLTEHSGPRYMHKDFCIISDRPEVLLVDEQNRPHCDNGPFCRWRDGTALYAVHGTRVPWWVIEKPELLTVDVIAKEGNAEVRRVMIDRYGTQKYLEDSKATEVSRGRGDSILYRKEVPDDEPICMIRLINSTKEPDGSNKHYWIRVPPTMKTADEALAWINWEDNPTNYNPSVET